MTNQDAAQGPSQTADILLSTQDCKEAASDPVAPSGGPAGVCLPAKLEWSDVGCTISLGGETKTVRARDGPCLQKLIMLVLLSSQMLQVLSKAYGAALPGEMVGLLGPSGAGKSTLLDILAGRKSVGKQTGTVSCNGRPLGAASRQLSAYVPQENHFVPTLTTAETLGFAAKLSMPQRISRSERRLRCHDILDSMGLLGSQHTQVRDCTWLESVLGAAATFTDISMSCWLAGYG